MQEGLQGPLQIALVWPNTKCYPPQEHLERVLVNTHTHCTDFSVAPVDMK